jgi:HEAT repeat protein
VAVRAQGYFPERVDRDALVRLAREGSYRVDAAEAMGLLGDPDFLPVLEECLEVEEDEEEKLPLAAFQAVMAYMSDDAVAVLLRVAGQARSRVWRATLMGGVKSIQEYQEALADWERRLATRQTRDGAIADLLTLLDDDDATVRAEAARGLATLGAVDQLPQLIRLLKDDDATVRAAARQALDALHERGTGEG